MPSHQASLYVEKCKPLQVTSIETPSPEPGEILIKVQAASFNPVDWFIRYFGIIVESFPFVIGFDLAGTITEIGTNVKNFKVGDKVFTAGMGRIAKTGAFQEYAIAEERFAALIPSDITVEEAVTIPLVAFTAYFGMFHKTTLGLSLFNSGIGRDDAILIMGGSTNVGQAAIQFAKICGFGKIITTSSKQHYEYLKSLGVTHCVDRSLSIDAFLHEIKELVPSEKRLFALDLVGSSVTQTQAYSYLSDTLPGKYASARGQIVDWETKDGKPPSKPEGTHSAGYFAFMDIDPEFTSLFWTNVTELLTKKKFKGGEVLLLEGGLNNIEEGLKMIKENEVGRKKLVVNFS